MLQLYILRLKQQFVHADSLIKMVANEIQHSEKHSCLYIH